MMQTLNETTEGECGAEKEDLSAEHPKENNENENDNAIETIDRPDEDNIDSTAPTLESESVPNNTKSEDISEDINEEINKDTAEQPQPISSSEPVIEDISKAEIKTNDTPKVAQSIDTLQKCRICLGSDDLSDIFSKDGETTIAANIMMLCPTVKIGKKDMLPHNICDKCLQSLRVAVSLKTLGESTDKELRSTLKQKNKSLRETEFVVIDCNDDGAEVEENINFYSDDDEFRPPTDYDVSESNSSSDSSYNLRKGRSRRVLRSGRNISLSSKRSKRTRSPCNTSSKKTGRPRKIEDHSEIDKKVNKSMKDSKLMQCVYCDKMFKSLMALREHKRAHAGEKPFKCDVCDRTFKFVGSFKSHKEKHKQADELMCSQCNKRFPNKTELRKHLVDVHNEPVAKFVCGKCKRAFTSEKRLDRHKEANCPGIETFQTRDKKLKHEPDSIALGRDLFKCVAPLTTTYWSDSFSD